MILSRRHLLVTAAAALATPTFTRNAWAALDTQSQVDATAKQYSFFASKYTTAQYNTISLCCSGPVDDARYAAVWAKLAQPVLEDQYIGLPPDQFQQQFNNATSNGFQPVIVTATGPADNPIFSGVFWKLPVQSMSLPGLTADQLKQNNANAQWAGNALWWLDGYGTPGNDVYTAIWGPNPTKEVWTCEETSDSVAQFQDRYNAQTSAWARIAHIVVTPSNRYLGMFADSTIGPSTFYDDMTKSAYLAQLKTEKSAGRAPVRISAKGSGANTKYAAIFNSRLDIDQRSFRNSNEVASVPAVDTAMHEMLKNADLRGAALAILYGPRLVYAKGYTYAEPGYPDVHATTFFRLASVSKMFAGIAIYQFMQDQSKKLDPTWLDKTTLQSVLKLNATDKKFSAITLRHLLEHTSGLYPGLVSHAKQAGIKTAQMLNFIAAQTVPGTPGDKSEAFYSNTGYFMLSQVIAKLRKASSFAAALKPLLDPLAITRVRQARSLVGNQLKDEARYHLRRYDPNFGPLYPLRVSTSVLSAGLVPLQYGGSDEEGDWVFELFDGSGGLSAAVTDVARLVAMLSVQSKNPVLHPDTLKDLFVKADAATKDIAKVAKFPKDAHGFYGFDSLTFDANKFVATGDKDGWVPGAQTFVNFQTGGLASVLLTNGNLLPDSQWLKDAINALKDHPWGKTDLFPQFGMPSLAG